MIILPDFKLNSLFPCHLYIILITQMLTQFHYTCWPNMQQIFKYQKKS